MTSMPMEALPGTARVPIVPRGGWTLRVLVDAERHPGFCPQGDSMVAEPLLARRKVAMDKKQHRKG
jgi:hypothetical protein